MSRKGLEGRQRGSILVQLGASAGVLVLPPLMMSAGVALFGAQTEDRLQISSEQTIASAVSKSSALIPLSSRPREVSKSADRPPLHDEPAASASQPATAAAASTAATAANAEPVVEADESSEGKKTEAAAEPVPFLGPIPVTLVVVRKEPEPEPAEPEEEPTPGSTPEPTPPAPPVASIGPFIPHATPKAATAHLAHPHLKPDREEARAPHRIAEKRPHGPVGAPHGPAPHPSAAASHRATAGASVAAKGKPRLQHRADLEN
jgi:hypothetical protein